ncbi:MAG TPA: N-acetyltransferase [Herpetosiphonaceae bacterium]
MTKAFAVRPATRADVPAIADLLLEGFGHEYGGMLRQRAGRRFIERIHALPGRLNGIIVAVDGESAPIGVAGLRTWEMQARFDRAEEQAMFEELGVGPSILLDVRAALTEPPPYRPQITEAYIYSVAVTQTWRGHGVADSLLEYLHCRAQEMGKSTALLEVVATNRPALRLYERHGYTLVKRRRGLLAWLPLGVSPLLLLCKQL